MLPPDGESDRFLATKDLKLVGYRRGIFVFCYVVRNDRALIYLHKIFAHHELCCADVNTTRSSDYRGIDLSDVPDLCRDACQAGQTCHTVL